ncbi:tRNA uridine-5-carboxymethylaminomethyl(34) synthesis GTPase MnmE [Bauldia sp.]|uniref:tRNA uridine-5-carboxymethylaminomethyl(34) synthesis GTPase MnmE n=1 Tax=Bauldia sp. TaxID=2575872 RepID=UPI003BA86FD2
MTATDTIFALATGGLPSGIAIVRVSGPRVRRGLEALVGSVPQPRRAALRSIHDEQGQLIDRAIVVFFAAPATFTGEDIAELHLHGGRAVVGAALKTLGRIDGFRPAEAGEFTRRAFANSRVDLTQVEGLADLVLAETDAQRRQALRQADGVLGAQYEDWRQRLIRARALLEAELDFPDEDDVPGSASDAAWEDVGTLIAEMDAHLADGRRGERLRDGYEIVVLGPPNAGKSSLVNALARRDVAIVSTEPGTTRDLIEVRLDLDGYPVTVIDTAGMRESVGIVEEEGIRRARARAAQADLVLWLTPVGDELLLPVTEDSQPVIAVGTKIDLAESHVEDPIDPKGFDLLVSSRTGRGIDSLISTLADRAAEAMAVGEAPAATRERHRSAITTVRDALATAGDGGRRPLELRADDLRRATDALGRLTGRVDVEELLDVVFRDFCIGK